VDTPTVEITHCYIEAPEGFEWDSERVTINKCVILDIGVFREIFKDPAKWLEAHGGSLLWQ